MSGWIICLLMIDLLTLTDLIGVTYGKGPWMARMFSTTFFICFQNFCRSYCDLVISLKLHFFLNFIYMKYGIL